jgi:hypothetical protein
MRKRNDYESLYLLASSASLGDEPMEYPNSPKMIHYEYWDVVIVGGQSWRYHGRRMHRLGQKLLILERGPSLVDVISKRYDDALHAGVEGTPITSFLGPLWNHQVIAITSEYIFCA